MTVGWILGGFRGIVVGVAISGFLVYPVIARAVHRLGIWTPGLDFAAVGVVAVAIILGKSL
jgi:hypothetical protein